MKKDFNFLILIMILLQLTNTFHFDVDIHEPHCEIHSDTEITSLNFGLKPYKKSRMLCSKCMVDAFNNQEKLQSLVDLKDFVKNPGETLLKLKKASGNEIGDLLEIEKSLVKFEEVVKNQLAMIRQNIQQMKTQIAQMTTELENNLKLKDVVKQFDIVRSMDSCQGSNELIQLEEQLNNISLNLGKTYNIAKEKVMDNQKLIINNFNNNFNIIQNEIKQLNQTSSDQLNKIVYLGIPSIIFEDLYLFPEIHQMIANGKQISYQLIYQGSRDGLSAHQYWNKCNQQSQLLIIMTSKNGNKFGGYIPSQLNSQLNNYIHDPSMKSFIFQYNKKEIYKIKSQINALWSGAGQGPSFGVGDIVIAADFSGGSTKALGDSYDIENYNIENKATHIFGAETPQLQECKVYKVITHLI